MERTELIDNVAGTVTALTAAACYTFLFLAMSAPVVETLQHLVS